MTPERSEISEYYLSYTLSLFIPSWIRFLVWWQNNNLFIRNTEINRVDEMNQGQTERLYTEAVEVWIYHSSLSKTRAAISHNEEATTRKQLDVFCKAMTKY